jgi:peptidoglycan/LPS O-acetylase OafA/YrhL
MRPNQQRNDVIDGLKVLAAQVIILHHCMSYGELAAAAKELLPIFSVFVFDYGRYAVQIFLVMAGYLAAQSFESMLAVQTHTSKNGVAIVVQLALRRYLRLVGPYLVALLVTIACAALARQWSIAEYIGSPETLQHVLAHLFLLQGLLGYDSISAGVWYVAIDWQLYTVLALLYAIIPQRTIRISILTVLCLASLLYFNRHADYENTFIYFIGSYGLGVMAYWASSLSAVKSMTHQAMAKKILIAIAVILIISAMHSVWLRNYLALAVALLIMYAGQAPNALNQAGRSIQDQQHQARTFWASALQWASARAYCAFLIHFAFILLANTALIVFDVQSPAVAVAAIGLVSVLSWIAANYLYRWVELPVSRWRPAALFS